VHNSFEDISARGNLAVFKQLPQKGARNQNTLKEDSFSNPDVFDKLQKKKPNIGNTSRFGGLLNPDSRHAPEDNFSNNTYNTFINQSDFSNNNFGTYIKD